MLVLYAAVLLGYELYATVFHRKTWTERAHAWSGLPVWVFCFWLIWHLMKGK